MCCKALYRIIHLVELCTHSLPQRAQEADVEAIIEHKMIKTCRNPERQSCSLARHVTALAFCNGSVGHDGQSDITYTDGQQAFMSGVQISAGLAQHCR